MKIGPLVEVIDRDDTTILIPAYVVPQSAVDKLARARKSFGTRSYEGSGSASIVSEFQAIYGSRHRHWRLLTKELATTLSGQTVPMVTGQRWMDDDLTQRQRSDDITLVTVHGVFIVKSKPKGWFSSPSENVLCILTLIRCGRRDKKTSTFQSYLHDRHFGTGGGHDPVFAYL